MSSIIYRSRKLVLSSMYLMHNLNFYSRKVFIVILLVNLLINGSSAHQLNHNNDINIRPSFYINMTKSPESTIAPQGDEVQFECDLNLKPDELQWKFRPQDTPHNKDGFVYVHKSPGYNITSKDTLSRLHVYVNQKTVGDYQCVAWFGASAITSISAKLQLATIGLDNKDGTRYVQPTSVINWKISPKNSLIIKCGDVISFPPPVWNYFKDDIPIASTVAQLPSGGLILTDITAADNGVYSCSAVNSITGQEIKLAQKISLTVVYTPRSPPAFLIQPPSFFSVKPGNSILLECPGVGNPAPKAIWSRNDGVIDTHNNRSATLGHGLQIQDAKSDDNGTYFCRLDNGITPVLTHTVQLNVLQQPNIIEAPKETLTNESDSLELNCHATGTPIPTIYWMINGQNTKWDSSVRTEGSKLIIRSVEKKHAGIVQCFARNVVGEVNEGNLLRVNPKQIPGEVYGMPLGTMPQKSKSRNNSNNKTQGGRRRNKQDPILSTVSKPNITRLSDESVMVKWSVPSNEGLPIQFFKVQYLMNADSQNNKGQRQNKEWITANEDIPPHLRSYEVNNLKPDRNYKFRISAVYSNNDNKQSAIRSFHLRRGSLLIKNHLAIPVIGAIETVSETEVNIKWTFPEHAHPVEGFYVHYRPTTTAEDYEIATAEGLHKRNLIIKHLEAGTIYEFKIHSFTALQSSEFSPIVTGRTLKTTTMAPTINPTVIAAREDAQGPQSFLPLIVGAVGVCALLFLIFILVFIAVKRRNMSRDDQESKSHPNHIQVEPNVNGSRGLSSPIHRNRLVNGVIRINITPNPLDEKNDMMPPTVPHQQSPHHQPSPPQQQQQQHQQHQQQQQQQHNNQQQLPPMGPHRRTLERNIRNNHQTNQHNHSNGMLDSTKMMIDGDCGIIGIPVVRNPSIRRTPRRGSNNSVNGSPRIMRNTDLHHHQQHQRSPMPIRANGKQRRMGGRNDLDIEQSSCSLNSIEV